MVIVTGERFIGFDFGVCEEEGGLVSWLAGGVVEDPGESGQGGGEAEGFLFVTRCQGKIPYFFSAEGLDGGLARVNQGHESFRGEESAWESGGSGFGLGLELRLGLGLVSEGIGRVPDAVDVGA